ncbi:MAG: DUF2807 domain-containing protein [Anaerolineaceae bacterium]|nr:DUF2807 domain-containing protein [Anaerolineaceae bacterium]
MLSFSKVAYVRTNLKIDLNYLIERVLMNKMLFILTFIISALVIGACGINLNIDVEKGSGIIVTEERSVSDFDRLDLSGIGDVTLIQGDQESLKIEAEDNVIKHITSEVRNGTLYIAFDRKTIIPTESVIFTVTMNSIRGLDTKGVSNLQSESLTTDSLEVGISGTGNIQLEKLTADKLSINVSGAGNFQASGTVNSQKVSLSGAGNYEGEDLQCKTAEVTITGIGRISLWVTDNLDVTISGTGGVDYYGTPRITQQISGVGKINHKGNK